MTSMFVNRYLRYRACKGYFFGLELVTCSFALQKDFRLVITFFDDILLLRFSFAQKNSRAGVNCRTLLNFEKCMSLHS